MLINLMVAEKSGFSPADNPDMASLKELADKMTNQVVDSLEENNGKATMAVAKR